MSDKVSFSIRDASDFRLQFFDAVSGYESNDLNTRMGVA